MKWNSIIFLFAVLCLVSPLSAQEEPSYEVAVTTVTVWVKVVDDKGSAVEGLTEADFDVFEDKQKMQINCFEEVKVEPQASTAAPAPALDQPAFQQKFAIYLDLFNMAPDELRAIRPRLKDFLTSIAPRKPEVMMAALMPNQKLGIISPFTKDLSRVKSLLDKAPANSFRDNIQNTRRSQMQKVIEGAGDELIDALRDGYALANSFAEEDEQRSRFTLAALETFASHLTNLNFGDHVVVLYISGGFSSDPGRQYYDVMDELASSAENQEQMQAMTFHRRPNFDFQKELQKSIGKLNRFNVTISTLDTQGMESTSEYRDSLVKMADETGGISFSGSRNFELGLDKVLDDLKHQYILCYGQPQHKKRGEYHTIKVAVRRPDTHLRHRDGYVD